MDEKDKRYLKLRVEGDTGESIFKFLIGSMTGWDIIPYGVETHVIALKKQIKDDYSETPKKIKYMPDFVILNAEKKIVMLVEVKKLGYVGKTDSNKLIFGLQKNLIDDYLKFWKEAKLFIIHHQEPYFYIIDLKDVLPSHKDASNVFANSENERNNKRPMDNWNFKDIAKNIKDVFPDLDDGAISEAIKMIPKKEPEQNGE